MPEGRPDKADLRTELRALTVHLDRVPTRAAIKGHSQYDPGEYLTEYDTWENAIIDAGFTVTEYEQDRYASITDPAFAATLKQLHEGSSEDQFRAEILAELRRLSHDLGKTPSTREFDEFAPYSRRFVIDRYESWNAAIDAAGLKRNAGGKGNRVSKQALKDELRRLADELGRRPSPADMNDHGKYSVPLYYKQFDSWPNACEECL